MYDSEKQIRELKKENKEVKKHNKFLEERLEKSYDKNFDLRQELMKQNPIKKEMK
tara:strand:+ start:41 stop:205 length:165 start_codon:yes stop_codon:yes gene_type:complete